MNSCAILILATLASTAQEPVAKPDKPVETSVRFITETDIASLTLEIEPLGKWIKPVLDQIDAKYAGEKASRDVVIEFILHKKAKAEAIISGRPSLSDAEAKSLLAIANLAEAPKTKVVDVVFRVETKIRGGDPDPSHKFTPELIDPFQRLLQRFSKATTAEQVAIFRDWATDEAIPLIAAEASRADPKFAGVVNFAKTLAALDFKKPIDVEALTDRNPDFWRATMEMIPTIPMTPTAEVALFCVTGKLDRASKIAELASAFDGNRSAASRLLGEFRTLHGVFSKGVERRIRAGIALHDKGDFAGAIKVYEGVLHDYPDSAWANYERFHSRRLILMTEKKSLEETYAGWPAARKAILAADPLYPTLAQANGGDESYDLIQRLKMGLLFKDKSKREKDILAYADIARDLGQNGFASMIDWYAVSSFRPVDQAGHDLIEEMLYGLERLGVKKIKENFKGDHAAEFAKIDARRKKARDESPAAPSDGGAKPEPLKK